MWREFLSTGRDVAKTAFSTISALPGRSGQAFRRKRKPKADPFTVDVDAGCLSTILFVNNATMIRLYDDGMT